MLAVYIPSRVLNEERGVLGLKPSDFAGAILEFVLLTTFLESTPYSILAVPAALITLAILSPIRLSTRSHIIRDVLTYCLLSSGRRIR